jgi:PAS domain S-box-containing protein
MPSGEVRWQRWSDRAIFDKDGRVIEYQSVGRDITDRKEAEEKLALTNEDLHAAYEQLTATEEELRQNYDELSKSQQELHASHEQLTATEEELRQNYDELAKSQQELQKSEERYRNVVEDQTEFICRFTPDGRLTFVNDAYCRYFGLDKDACIGCRHTVVIPPEDLPQMKQHLSAFTPENPTSIIEHRIVMPSGEVRWQRWSDRAIFDKDSRIVEYQSVGRDITDRKRTDYALYEANKKLNLLSSITRHDILNQLTVLQGYCGLIEGKTTDPMTKEWILKTTQASEVIRSQISFTQQYQDLGMQKPLWQDIALTAMIVCQNNGFSQVSIDENLAGIEVFADPLLKTVFYHFFENAVMHGGKMTRITVQGKATPKYFTLIVEDDGDGISPDDKKSIFQKGYGKHTGLGLFLVREVLSITGLTIEETGKFGKGARFEIQVPADMYRKSSKK